MKRYEKVDVGARSRAGKERRVVADSVRHLSEAKTKVAQGFGEMKRQLEGLDDTRAKLSEIATTL